MYEWNTLPWKVIEKDVCKLQNACIKPLNVVKSKQYTRFNAFFASRGMPVCSQYEEVHTILKEKRRPELMAYNDFRQSNGLRLPESSKRHLFIPRQNPSERGGYPHPEKTRKDLWECR